uniref:Uncharacterized protein n=1 Tax=Vannella robusta TaxID=1487602 RepID=A0A7S4MR09_9EUKA
MFLLRAGGVMQVCRPISTELRWVSEDTDALDTWTCTLTGTLVEANLTRFSCLVSLKIEEHKLTGPIPAELGTLRALRNLELSCNELEGCIPRELGSLTELRRLGLGNNKLRGEIPQELENLENLRYLNLRCNQLDGTIPAALGQVYHLDLSQNELYGEVPLLKLQS